MLPSPIASVLLLGRRPWLCLRTRWLLSREGTRRSRHSLSAPNETRADAFSYCLRENAIGAEYLQAFAQGVVR